MIAPFVRNRRGLAARLLLTCVVGGVGLVLGWTLTRRQPSLADWLVPGLTLTSTLVLAIEVVCSDSKRRLWVACACAVVMALALYELARLAGL